MLSIAAAGAGHGEYYLNLARSDYYLEAGEPPGRWHGSGADRLGLSGLVEEGAFQALLAGELPSGAQAVQRQEGKAHKAGYDLTFSAPKSVSALWAVGGKELREAIERAVDASIDAALAYIEETATFTRRGHGGMRHEHASLVSAKFLHGSSRNLDPHLHVHVFVMNLCVRDDGSTGTLYGPALFQAKMAAGALFRAELSSRLEKELGLEMSRDGMSFSVDGIPEDLVKLWSSRRHEIEEALSRKGHSSAKASAVAALDTRAEKVILPRVELYDRWEKEARSCGYSPEAARTLVCEPKDRDFAEEWRGVLTRAMDRLTIHQSHFAERDLVRLAALEAQATGLGAERVLQGVRSHLETSEEIVLLGTYRGSRRYTTKDILALEKSLLHRVEVSKGAPAPGLSDETVRSVVQARPTITEEQVGALRHATKAEGSIRLITGMAGTGKTFLLSAVKDAFEGEGYSVLGAALAGKAARGLEEGAGIRSSTIHSLLLGLEDGSVALDKKTVLVLDEAGMIGTRQMEQIVRLAEESCALLLLVGDARQLQPIEHGGPFAAMAQRLGEARLENIIRQKAEWARDAVRDIASGHGRDALRAFAERGLLFVEDENRLAEERLIGEWRKVALESPRGSLIFAGSNQEVTTLNRLAQDERLRAGRLGRDSIVIGGEVIFEGDRVLFTRNRRCFGVCNGDLGTVLKRHAATDSLLVQLDSGRTVHIPLGDYRDLKLGYAVTTHKGQGVTCDYSFVLVDAETGDLHSAYVQASRAKLETRIFTDRLSAGDELADLVRAVERERQKDLAHDVAAHLEVEAA